MVSSLARSLQLRKSHNYIISLKFVLRHNKIYAFPRYFVAQRKTRQSCIMKRSASSIIAQTHIIFFF